MSNLIYKDGNDAELSASDWQNSRMIPFSSVWAKLCLYVGTYPCSLHLLKKKDGCKQAYSINHNSWSLAFQKALHQYPLSVIKRPVHLLKMSAHRHYLLVAVVPEVRWIWTVIIVCNLKGERAI